MAHPTQKIEMDVQVDSKANNSFTETNQNKKQVVSGAYWAAFKPHGMTNVYRNVQNVVVKLHGQSSDFHGNGNHSLMLNCHFDSVAGSPGKSSNQEIELITYFCFSPSEKDRVMTEPAAA